MMTLPKLLAFSAIVLFGFIGIAAAFKNNKNTEIAELKKDHHQPIEIMLDQANQPSSVLVSVETPVIAPKPKVIVTTESNRTPIILPPLESTTIKLEKHEKKVNTQPLPDADRMNEFFNLTEPKLPIVETVTYKSRVSWLKGRPAWLSDYAGHYRTSRHFIARSLNGKPDYLKQDLAEGARFNILKPEKNIHFNLIVDTSRCKLWFYYHDLDTKEKVLIKTYPVGLGRIDHAKISGLLTPLGIYTLGSRIAVYQPKVMGNHNGTKIEMVRVFGTRWIPFEKEISHTTASAKGYGIHGLPWISKNGSLVEDVDSLGKYESDGCIRMTSNDIEELYSIIITRPTTIEIVKDFFDAENKIQITAAIENN